MTSKVLKYTGAILAGALTVVPAGLVDAEMSGRDEGGGRAPAVVMGATPAEVQAPSAAELVGKLLAPPASNPDVPLPHPGLAERSEAPPSLAGPTLYGRQEPGGGVLGFRMPIPAGRGGSPGSSWGNTRYGSPSLPSGGVALPPLQSR